MLVLTRNLPTNLPEVYVESVNGDSDSDEHEDSSSDEEDDDDDEDSSDRRRTKRGSHERGAQELKIQVYNHTVEFRERRRLVVSFEVFFLTPLW